MAQSGPALAKIHELARAFRENARETCLLEYAQLMMRTAGELEDLAAGMECGQFARMQRTEAFASA